MPVKKDKEKVKTKKKISPKEKNVEKEISVDLSVGEILRRARVSEKLSLDAVEDDIRIRASMLQAIEDMELNKLPGWIYTVGFVRSYSEYLGLDSDKMIALLKSQVGENKKEHLNFPVTVSESSLPSPWVIGTTIGMLCLLVAAVYLFQNFTNSQNMDVNEIPPVPEIIAKAKETVKSDKEEEIVAAVQARNSSIPAEDTYQPLRDENGILLPRPKPAPSQTIDAAEISDNNDYRIVINVIDESWVEIKNGSGEILVSRVLKLGDQYYVPSSIEGLTMTTGNIAGLKIEVDGSELKTKSQRGDVKKDIPLDPESLKEMFP